MMSIPLLRRPALLRLALAILPLAVAVPAAAQTSTGSVEGVAHGAEEGATLAFSLIRLLPVDPQAVAPQGVITDAEGRFRFADVPAGPYQLQVEQIGYERILSPVVRVRPGETLRHDVRGTPAPIRLDALTVTGGRCLTADQLHEDPELATLWNEAKKGVETRRAFERQYRYTRTISQLVETRWRLRPTTRKHLEDTTVSEPDSVAVREQRRRARHQADGYVTGNLLTVPDEKELLDDAFLREHCLEPSFDEGDGAYALRFRSVRPRRNGESFRGTIRVDADTYLLRRVEFEYLDGRRQFAESHIDYADTPVGGSTLRLPAGGQASIRPRGPARPLIARAMSTITYRYLDVRPVRAN